MQMELKKTVSFSLKPHKAGDVHHVTNVTLIFNDENDVLNRAVNSAVIFLQGKLRNENKNKPLEFKKAIGELCEHEYIVPVCGTREYSSGKAPSTKKIIALASSITDKFPGISRDDMLNYMLTLDEEKPQLEAQFAVKYLKGKSTK